MICSCFAESEKIFSSDLIQFVSYARLFYIDQMIPTSCGSIHLREKLREMWRESKVIVILRLVRDRIL